MKLHHERVCVLVSLLLLREEHARNAFRRERSFASSRQIRRAFHPRRRLRSPNAKKKNRAESLSLRRVAAPRPPPRRAGRVDRRSGARVSTLVPPPPPRGSRARRVASHPSRLLIHPSAPTAPTSPRPWRVSSRRPSPRRAPTPPSRRARAPRRARRRLARTRAPNRRASRRARAPKIHPTSFPVRSLRLLFLPRRLLLRADVRPRRRRV